MLSEEDCKIASEFHQRLKAIVPVLDLLVFGSRARGEASVESDLDVFIVVETITPMMRQRISEIAWEVGFEMDRIISTIVATPDQLENGPMAANPLILKIEQEGVRV
ncbi:MAG: nucleotidyltransferase domain-containing protein [bacterium]